MAEFISINQKESDDPYYRYNMPEIQIKQEGSGNGKKTVLLNIAEIADTLNRDVAILARFMAQHFGTIISFKKDKWIINGTFDAVHIQKSIYEFIDNFVLCKQCNNPETIFKLDKQNNLRMKCTACSFNINCSNISALDKYEKICKAIVRTINCK